MRALFLLMVVFILTACPATTPVGQPKPVAVTNGTVEFFPLKDVITVIKRALQASQNKISDDNLPPLESVTLTLQTTKGKTDEFTANLVVIGGSQSSESSDTQQLVIKLTPPKANAETPVSASLYERLVDAITAAST
ncbi:MAG TPA: trypco2 family protein, partial [Gemmatimonadaceae bacterium]|nr:trypco2 family protein [Gemmatimonadaceae bacterium]